MLRKRESPAKPRRIDKFLLPLLINVLLAGAIVASQLLLGNLFLTLTLSLLLLIGDYFLLSEGRRKKERAIVRLEKDFSESFRCFSVFVETGMTPYQALRETLPFSSPALREKIETLLHEIDEDKSVAPYVRFSDGFRSLAVRQVMIAIHRMASEGGGEAYLRQFRSLFQSYGDESRKKAAADLDGRMGMASFLPLVASALVMALIAIGIVSVLGVAIHGI